MTSTEYVMTQEQQGIFNYRPLNMVITAPAGCGKTEALAYRAKGLINRYDFAGNGRKLLVVSFTNQAKDNISERIKKHIGLQTMRQHVTVCNFHGLSARIINAHREMIGLDDEWTVASFDWIGRFMQSLNCDRKVKMQAREALQKIKLECLTDKEVKAKIQTIYGQVGNLAQIIEKERIKEKIITYDDQIRTALWILQNKNVAKLYRNHFFAALVDEFQDLTHQQLRLVQALCKDRVTFAGDLAQGIYSFAGGDARFVFHEITKNTEKQVKLLKSFRSSPAILDAVNSLSPRTGSEHLSAAFPEHWGNGGLSSYASFNREDAEAEWVVRMCQLILERCPEHRIGIISRTAFRAESVKSTLKSHNISYADWGNGLFRPETAKILRNICDELSVKSCKEPEELMSFIKKRYTAFHGNLSEEHEDACGWLFDRLAQSDASSIAEVKRCINAKKGNETIATRKGIHCLTGHAGKGQQFDWVFIVGLEEGTIPFYKAKSEEAIDEEARVLSVMISRARIGYVATSSSTNPRFWYSRNASSFLRYLQHAPNFLFGKDQIELWCAEADWTALSQM
ncbi:UvrD-helicase domain-containing protein [Bifidobacterium breve]|uniref:UvrD-helicase domain-containing protein n=1 Tax=Bifidobacterium breve TaxID=1685 RepID=UPI001B10C7E5|nr:hypothetical protein MCC01954_01530 [Bifidobacteriaceae bacterium MCC01954]